MKRLHQTKSWGEMPRTWPPNPPSLISTDGMSFSFILWSPAVTVSLGDDLDVGVSPPFNIIKYVSGPQIPRFLICPLLWRPAQASALCDLTSGWLLTCVIIQDSGQSRSGCRPCWCSVSSWPHKPKHITAGAFTFLAPRTNSFKGSLAWLVKLCYDIVYWVSEIFPLLQSND